jgi:hypothetical protein
VTDVLNIVDATTRPDMLRQLAMLAGTGERVISVGPPPSLGAMADLRPPSQPATAGMGVPAVHCPMGSPQLAGLRMRPHAAGAGLIHAWSLPALLAGRELSLATGVPLLASLPCAGRAEQVEALRSAVGPGLLAVTVPSRQARRKLLAAGLPERFVHLLPPAAGAIPDRQALRERARRELGIAESVLLIVAPDPLVRYAGHKYASWTHGIVRYAMAGRAINLLLPGSGRYFSTVRFFALGTGFPNEVLLTEDRLTAAASLAAADAAVFFHEHEVGPLALAEAMAAGLPIVASNVPELAEYAPDGQAALLAKPGDPRQAGAALLRLLEEPDLAARLAHDAQARAAEQFDPARVRGQMEGIREAAGEVRGG